SSDTLSRQTKRPEMDGSSQAMDVHLRPRRKLSSRIYSSETPRNRFRQRRAGWYEEDEEDEETDSSPRNSGTISRDSDPALDSKEVARNLELGKDLQNKNSETSSITDSTEGWFHFL
ncbi:hypothetical protein scyTo_0024879, partial [Scyliorhinus torazame]|nr:hypothetical protein [Scyliorhinus torazame]